MRIAGSTQVYGLARAARIVVPARRTTVILRASKAGLKALRLAFRNHRRVTASLTVTARDAAGNQSVGTRTLRAVNY
jgi:non-homologous end joining protein Ku